MAKCRKCKKTINPANGFYNYPSGVLCLECGENKAQKLDKIREKYGMLGCMALEHTIKA